MEKFGILNLLKALETLTPPPAANGQNEEEAPATQPKAPPTPAAPPAETHNVMASVLCRHEEIANRVKNNRR
ncbi:MAG: hypothetical protein K2N30_05915 [Clostridia bacterium]|nr:hypothetical protein [Clostridia bacterium]